MLCCPVNPLPLSIFGIGEQMRFFAEICMASLCCPPLLIEWLPTRHRHAAWLDTPFYVVFQLAISFFLNLLCFLTPR